MNKLLIESSAWLAAGIIWLLSVYLAGGRLTRTSFMIFGLVAMASFSQSVLHGFLYATPLNSEQERLNLLDVLIMTAPFGLLSAAITARRLKALGTPEWIAALSLVPCANLFLYLYLSLQDSVSEPRLAEVLKAARADKIGCAILAFGSAALLLLAGCILAVTVLREYVLLIFRILPFFLLPLFLGTCSSLFYGSSTRRTFGECQSAMLISVSALPCLLLLLCVVEALFEGFKLGPMLSCVIVFLVYPVVGLLPLAAILGALGATVGYFIQKRWTPSG